ncbi:MAG: HAD-IIIC family phosphatase [Cyanosarcina radialis HA8281-LM2]|nr:HAD-IIIC family phosphatase [Cyanosarcina radialis HA8281-LM2]
MISVQSEPTKIKADSQTTIKCVVWDLDNTIWDGVLLEGDRLSVRQSVVDAIQTLDRRGILQSIASKNDAEAAINKLLEIGLYEYFLYPQINWNRKSYSIQEISRLLNIGIDSIAFIDDSSFELEEVKYSLPQVLCINALDIDKIVDLPAMNPRFITEDSKQRRSMYLSDIKRQQKEAEFVGTPDEFLATLQMKLTISPAGESDLQRAEELTVRTHQLNTTGYTYSYEELNYFSRSPQHKLLIASLEDKYGTYGKIGLTLLKCQENTWTIELLLMSCRVMSRGVGTVTINHIMRLAKDNQVKLLAKFLPNDRNRQMYITYKFAGFKEIDRHEKLTILENDLTRIQPLPDYLQLLT